MSSYRPPLAGVIAAGAGIAVSELAAAVFSVRESPVLAVAQSVISLTPGSVAESIISVVGTKDKPIAVVSVVLAILALGALLGHWWVGRRNAALGAIAVLVGLAVWAVVDRPNTSFWGVVSCLAAGATVVGVLMVLRDRGDERSPHEERRAFLRNAGILVAATAVLGGVGELLASRRRQRDALEKVRAALQLPLRPTSVPAGTDFAIQGIAPWRTPNRIFYRIDTALTLPLIDPAEWSLRIHGMVDREMTITYQDLLDRGLEDAWVTLCCVSNPVGGELIGNATWGGVRMADILADVGIQPGADALFSTSDDGWTCGTPLDVVTDGRDAMLALTMDGEPLPVAHGFPVRQVVPGLYGYVSATKWVTDWEITRFADREAYWTQRGWGERGPVKTHSRIDVPRDSSSLAPGPTTIAGVAWAQHRGIERVEVKVGDDGGWQEAELGRVPTNDSWVQWKIAWDAPEGFHFIQVRATDKTGETQTSIRAGVLPDGATGYHGINVDVS